MKNKPNQLIIIGSGVSLKEGISKGLWDKLKGKFVINCNYNYRYFADATINTFVDRNFYHGESKREDFQNLPLIIGKKHGQLKPLLNTITLQTNDSKYYRDIKLGIYKSNLCGIFSLSLGIYLLDIGTIFLLGFDNCAFGKDKKGKTLTHFYTDIKHRGIGKVSYFNGVHDDGKKFVDRDFEVFENEQKVKIYNVSPYSKINIFTKMGYLRFFEELDNQEFDQHILRQYIKEKLK